MPNQFEVNFGNIVINEAKGEVLKDGKPIVLTAKEYKLLLYLAKNPNYIISKKNLFETVWNEPYVSQEGLSTLKKYKAWIQILDENGNEVFSSFKPPEAPTHYSPVQIVHAHKYSEGIKGYTTFVYAAENNNYNWSYIIGFLENMIFKYTFYFDSKDLKYVDALFYNFTNIFITILFITIVITIIIGYAFAKKLTKPLFSIIDGIKVLSQGVYTQIYYNNGEISLYGGAAE